MTRFGTGAQVSLSALAQRDGVDLATTLFSESPARALVAVPAEHEERLTTLAAEHGVPVQHLGTTGGGTLEIDGAGSFSVGELRELREGTLPRYFA